MPAIKHVITVRGEDSGQGFSSLRRLIDETEPTPVELEQLAALRPDPMQVAHMGPTGGSTGTPKIVPRTHNSLGATAEFCSNAWTLDRDDTNLIVGSIGHDLSYTKGFSGQRDNHVPRSPPGHDRRRDHLQDHRARESDCGGLGADSRPAAARVRGLGQLRPHQPQEDALAAGRPPCRDSSSRSLPVWA